MTLAIVISDVIKIIKCQILRTFFYRKKRDDKARQENGQRLY